MLIFRADNLKIALSMFKSIFKINHLERIFNGEAFLLGGITGGLVAPLFYNRPNYYYQPYPYYPYTTFYYGGYYR